jgi:hypothetical protein
MMGVDEGGLENWLLGLNLIFLLLVSSRRKQKWCIHQLTMQWVHEEPVSIRHTQTVVNRSAPTAYS